MNDDYLTTISLALIRSISSSAMSSETVTSPMELATAFFCRSSSSLRWRRRLACVATCSVNWRSFSATWPRRKRKRASEASVGLRGREGDSAAVSLGVLVVG